MSSVICVLSQNRHRLTLLDIPIYNNFFFLTHRIYPDIIRLGAQNLKNFDNKSTKKDVGIEKIIPHPNYKRSSHYNDIALIKMTESIR